MSLAVIPALLVLGQTTGPVTFLKTIQGIRPIAYAPMSGSRFVASLENREIRIYDAKTRMPLKKFVGHPQTAYGIDWCPTTNMLASGDESGRIFFWSVASGKKIREVRTHTRGVQAVSFNKAGTVLVSTGKDDTLRFYQVSTGKELKVMPGKGANFYGARFVPGSESVIVGTLGQGSWVISGYQKKRSMSGHSDMAVWDVDIAGGKMVSAGRDGNSIVWNYASGAKIQTLKGHADWVINCAASPAGKWLATSSSDTSVKIWDLKSYQNVATLPNHTSVGSPLCFTADGKFLLTVGIDDFMNIYSVK